MTIQEHLGRLNGVKVCFIGVHNNVCNSLIAAGIKVGLEVTVIAPEVNPTAVDEELWTEAEQKGCYKTVSTDTINSTSGPAGSHSTKRYCIHGYMDRYGILHGSRFC